MSDWFWSDDDEEDDGGYDVCHHGQPFTEACDDCDDEMDAKQEQSCLRCAITPCMCPEEAGR